MEGARTSFVASMPPPMGTVGGDPVTVLYVYVPVGGNGHGDSGAVIDAFDATVNSLVNNDFVTVSPDPGGTLTTEANVDGWVDTQTSGYTITADHPNIGPYLALPTIAFFDQWVDLTDPMPASSLISGANLTPAQGQTVYALAFYHDPVKTAKEIIFEKNPSEFVLKSILEAFKGPKENVENPGFGNVVDPALIAGELRALNQRISGLEAGLERLGSAFVKGADRPQIGKKR
ncbi:MAG TPA: hypothetical protein VIW73_10960 [Candidatus Cybelea sp.]